ncbi:TonB-dependent receptor [Myxococcaceae bacterium GXIMD 01537]
MEVTRVFRSTGAMVVAGLLYGSAAYAQSSTIVGAVFSADTKKPAANVVVTATSPNLQGEQTVVTAEDGTYRIPQLPPGTYTLRFENEAYKPYTRSDVQLRLNRTIRVNVELLPTGVSIDEVLTVTQPTIDVGSTTTGVNVDQEFIRRIAVNRPGGRGGAARSFESLAELAPGAQNDQYGVSINGATSPENGYVVDGISTNDPAYGVNASPLSVEFVQDVQIITGGYLPEFGRSTGGVVTAVTRSGSNEFHGTVFANVSPGFAEGKRELVIDQGSVITGNNELKAIGDFGATLGGPIIKDKLWFFAGIAPSFARYTHTRAIAAFVGEKNADGSYKQEDGEYVLKTVEGRDDLLATQEIPGSQRKYFADQRSFQYMGKLTYLINSDHNVSVSVLGTPSTTGGLGKLAINTRSGALPGAQSARPGEFGLTSSDANSTSVALKYAGAMMDKKLLIDANFGWFHQVSNTLPADGSALGSTSGLAGLSRVQWVRTRPLSFFESVPNEDQYCGTTTEERLAFCPTSNYLTGGTAFISDAKLDRYQVNAKATYMLNALGQHLLKAGVDAEFLSYDQTKAYGGGVFFQEANLTNAWHNGSVVAPGTYGWTDSRRYGYQTGPDTAFTELTQKAKSTGTTIGGFLQDSWSIANRVTVNAGLRYDTQYLYGGNGDLALVLGNQISPRVGAIVDPFANGRAKLFVNYAKYYESVPLNLVDRAFPGERRFTGRHLGATETTAGCDPSTLEGQQGNCKDPAYNVRTTEAGRNPNRLYTGGKVENEPVDPNIEPQSSDEFVVGGEYEVIANTRVGANYTHRAMGAVIEDMSRDDGNTYFLGNPGNGFAKDFPEATRNYDAVTVYLNRNFADGWLAQASYTWSQLKGNYPGLFRPETGQLDPNILSDFDLIQLLDNRTGLLPFDRTHAVKLFGAKEFQITNALSASLGLSYRGNSGTPINYYGAHPDYGQDEVFVLERGVAGRTPWVHNIDTNLGVNYRISKDNVLSLSVDVFNLFNLQEVTQVDQSYTFESVYPVVGGTANDLPTKDREGNVLLNTGDPETDKNPETAVKLTSDQINPNFKKPTQYQAPRQIRFGIRYTF